VPGIQIEILIPDFGGQLGLVDKVLSAGPDVLSHNMETVARLFHKFRPGATFDGSLSVLRHAAGSAHQPLVKTGIMLGLGETSDEVEALLKDLKRAGCHMLTLGQYLRPDSKAIEVRRFVRPSEFKQYEALAYQLGFELVESGPFVRSSYHAGDSFEKLLEWKSRRSNRS